MTEAERVERVIGFGLRADKPRLGLEWSCLCCSFVARAASEVGLPGALRAHAEYVNTHADPATDPHFEAVRMNELIGEL